MNILGKPAAPTLVTSGRFEIEQDDAVAFLEYSLAGKVLELARIAGHTRMPRIGVGTRAQCESGCHLSVRHSIHQEKSRVFGSTAALNLTLAEFPFRKSFDSSGLFVLIARLVVPLQKVSQSRL